MAKPWESKHSIMSDLDQLCDMYKPMKNVKEKPVKMKLLTEGRNPSPVTIDLVDYLIEDHDFSDTECAREPNIELINSMMRDAGPSYSNNYIEQAYGNRGCLVQNAPQDNKQKVSPKRGNKSHSNGGEPNLVSDLNPCIKEFIPREELESGDFTPQSKNRQQKHSPKKCPEVDRSPQHNSYCNNSKYDSLSADMDNASILSLDSLSDCEYLDAESSDYVHTVEEEKKIESVSKNVPADNKENTLISAPLKPSPLVDGKLKRNCALQSMFDRFAQGETQFNNIEVNRECFANLGVAQIPVVISKPSDAMDKISEKSDDSSLISYNSNKSVDAEGRSVVPSEPLQDVAGCLNRSPNKNLDTSPDPKNKVAAWLCTDDNQTFATQRLNIVPSPKPKPINLSDEAFAFKVKNTNVVKGKTSVVKNVTDTKNIALQTNVNVIKKLEEKETDEPQPKGKMSVEEIYNKLKANQGKQGATTSTPESTKTYEKFVKVENVQQTSSNTLWDNIENAMHKKSWSNKPQKWRKLV